MRRKFLWSLISVMLCLALLPLSGEAEEWIDTFPDIADLDIQTTAREDAQVYADPSFDAKVIGTLKESPDQDKFDVTISRVRFLTDGKQEGYKVLECWWFISHPLEGWVEGPKLDLWYTGFLYGN